MEEFYNNRQWNLIWGSTWKVVMLKATKMLEIFPLHDQTYIVIGFYSMSVKTKQL